MDLVKALISSHEEWCGSYSVARHTSGSDHMLVQVPKETYQIPSDK